MGETAAPSKPEQTVSVVRGQHHNFMLIPVMAHNAEWFEAGPVTFAVEGRVLGDKEGKVGERISAVITNPVTSDQGCETLTLLGPGPTSRTSSPPS